jgi:long-chain acyl-CoA synthetase
MNIAQSVECGVRLWPDKPALIFEEEVFTYRELEEMASRVANGLSRLGVERGDRVALFLPNIPGWAFFYLALQKIGAIAVSLNATLKSEEAGFIINDSGAKAVVTTETLRPQVPAQALPHLKHCLLAEGRASEADISFRELIEGVSCRAEALEMERDAPAAIVYTSGTTGFPKGAVLSHGNVISNVEAKKRYLKIGPDDRLLLFLPLFHCFGQNAVFNSGLGAGATVVLHRQFSASRVLPSIASQRVTMFFGVPATFIILADRANADDLRSVRYYFSAAASLPPEIERRWQEKFGLPIHQGYGLTETSPFASYNHLDKHKSGSIGTPIENVEMKVVDVEDGSEVAPGTLGEIVIRGPNVMLGYWNRPAETAQVLKDGWFHTGDIGRVDNEGYFYLEDRLKDMVNVGGLKVYPAEIENIIYQHAAVAEAAVYGIPDALLGERVAAQIVLKPEYLVTPEEIMAHCRERLADYKVPSLVEFADSIPKNPTGKILKRILREAKSGTRADAQMPSVPGMAYARRNAQEIKAWMLEWLSSRLQTETGAIEVGRPFFDYGMNSLALVRLAQDLGLWLGCSVEATTVWNFPTIESLTEHLMTTMAGASPSLYLPSQSRPSSSEMREAVAAPESLKQLSDIEMARLLEAEVSAARQRKTR